jgi:hypothetical protein
MCAYGRDSGECYAAASTLAKDLCSTPRQVQRYWMDLRKEKWISSRRVEGRVSHHVFLWHPALAAAAAGIHDTGVVTPTTQMSLPHDTHVVGCIGSKERSLALSANGTSKVGYTRLPKTARTLSLDEKCILDALMQHAAAIDQVPELLKDAELIHKITTASGNNPRAAAALISKTIQVRFGPQAAHRKPWPEKLAYWVTVVQELTRPPKKPHK